MNLIDRLDELEKEATRGPWNAYDDTDSTGRHEIVARGVTVARIYKGNPKGTHDAPLIAELRNAWPKIHAALKAADVLAVHVQGILELGAVGTPETTNLWLANYTIARAALEEP